MGLFDFLKPQLRATPGAQSMAPDGQMMQAAPVLREKPGFLQKLTSTDANGASFQDRAIMALLALQGQGGAAMQMRQGFRRQGQDDAERQARNAAFKAAYDPATGKFDRSRFMEAMGPQGDAMDALEIESELNQMRPKSRIQVTSRGVYRIGEDDYEQLDEFEPEERLPFGWVRDPTGRPMPEPGGPADPSYIRQTAEERRRALVENPMPTRARGGARRGGPAAGVPTPPPGFRIITPGG